MILKAFLKHEILNLLKSRRVYTTVVMFLLLFASVFTVRVIDYQRLLNQYLTDVREADEANLDLMNYSFINPRAIHRPLVFSIYNQGFQFNRVISIRFYEPIVNSISLNEERNMFLTDNNQLDITFLITFFLSLFILLISYDSVNGEKQTGTLRLLMTYPIKRQSYILKKILGVFIFVSIIFTIPYVLSLLCLVFIYTGLLTSSFFLSAFFYWFLVMLFIFFFCLLGIFVSVCTTNPNRSLVYCLLVWLMFSIILPISWKYIVSPQLFDNQMAQVRQIRDDKAAEAHRRLVEVPEEAQIFRLDGAMNRNSGYGHSMFTTGFERAYITLYAFLRYLNESYFPAAREVEFARDNILRKQINIDNIKNMVFFFNPIVLFNDIGAKIAGNSRADYLRFLHDGRAVRDDFINLGVREGWVFDYRFFAQYADRSLWFDYEDELMMLFNSGDQDAIWERFGAIHESAELFSFEMPVYRRYEQPNYSFGEIFVRIAAVLGLFVVGILGLWVCTWYKFIRYDVR